MTKRFYRLYQMVSNEATRGRKFFDLPKGQDVVDLAEYQIVYNGHLEGEQLENDEIICDALFEKFNINHPADFRGHSMSVSDIVRVDDKCYICQGVGWKEVRVIGVPCNYEE